jgi:hypothetical protein
MSTGADSIARLRAIAQRLRERGDPDAAWFAAELAEIETSARRGVDLGCAFRLKPGRGETSWWEDDANKHRDDGVRSFAAKHLPKLKPHAATNEILRVLALYERVGWQRHKAFASPPPETVNTRSGDLFVLLKLGRPLTFKTIYTALRICPDKDDFRENDPCSHDREVNEG